MVKIPSALGVAATATMSGPGLAGTNTTKSFSWLMIGTGAVLSPANVGGTLMLHPPFGGEDGGGVTDNRKQAAAPGAMSTGALVLPITSFVAQSVALKANTAGPSG